MEAVSRHVRHTHRFMVRMVPCRQLVAQSGAAIATRHHKGVRLMNRKLSLVALLTLVAFVASPTRVARLNYVQGAVSFQPAGEQDWLEADINRPLTTGDNLWADHDSRGEIHIGATAIRLSSDTGISFLNLDDRTVQLQLAQGTIEVHLRRLEPGNAFEIDTP